MISDTFKCGVDKVTECVCKFLQKHLRKTVLALNLAHNSYEMQLAVHEKGTPPGSIAKETTW